MLFLDPATHRPPRNNAEKILMALEQATPLTESRRIRLQQKQAVKVPTPTPAAPISGRAGRMIMPYARPTGEKPRGKTKDDTIFSNDEAVQGMKPAGALRRYLEAGRKAREEKLTSGKEGITMDETPDEKPSGENNAPDTKVSGDAENLTRSSKGKGKEIA